MTRTSVIATLAVLALNTGLAFAVGHVDRYGLLALSCSTNATAAWLFARTAPMLPIASLRSQDRYRRLPMIFMAVLAATSLYSYLDGTIRDDLQLFLFGIGFHAIIQAIVFKLYIKAE